MEELIKKLNVLYHKRKSEGLTEAEQLEEKELKSKYLGQIRQNFKSQLDQIEIVDKKETKNAGKN